MNDMWAQTMGTKVLPVPADYLANENAAWLFTLWAGAGLGLLVVPWSLYRLLRKHDPIPLLLWIGGFISSLNEGTIDHNLHLWWPTNLPGPAYQTFGLSVPWLIPFCYAFYISTVGYWMYRKMQVGLSVKGVFGIWLLGGLSDALLEYPGLFFRVYEYYGDHPFEFYGFPWWQAWTNSTGFLMIGFCLWLFVPRMRGWNRLAVLVIPVAAFHGAWGAVAWPNYMALNFEGPYTIPVSGQWLLSALSLGICLVIVRGIGAVVTKDVPHAHGSRDGATQT